MCKYIYVTPCKLSNGTPSLLFMSNVRCICSMPICVYHHPNPFVSVHTNPATALVSNRYRYSHVCVRSQSVTYHKRLETVRPRAEERRRHSLWRGHGVQNLFGYICLNQLCLGRGGRECGSVSVHVSVCEQVCMCVRAYL